MRIPPQGDVEYVKLKPLSEMEPSVLKTTCVDRIGLATTWRINLLDKKCCTSYYNQSTIKLNTEVPAYSDTFGMSQMIVLLLDYLWLQ